MKAILRPYVLAVAATAAATLLRMLMAPLVGAGLPFATYFLATFLVMWYCGFRAAVVTILLSALAGTYFFVSPATTSPFVLSARTDRLTAAGFAFVTLTAAFLVDLQRRTLERVEREAIARKKAEEAEREQRQWLETTIASIGDAVIATDADGNVKFMNPVAARLTEWSAAEAHGSAVRQVFRIVNEETGSEAENPIDKVMQQGLTVGLANHTLLISRNGRQIPIDDSAAPIKRNGLTIGAVLVFRDVTERRRAHRELENSERRYRLLFESNPQPMWVYDRETLGFLAVNDAAVQQYGYSAEEFLHMTLKDIRPAEDIPALLEDVRQPSKFHRDGPWRHRKRDGTVITVEITAHPIEFEGRNAALVLATDITERKKLEEQFYQAQRLESIGKLAGGVAHDFNNLLTVINGYAAMILAELPPAHPQAHRVAEISSAGQRAAALTAQLLAFSRKQLIQPKVLNLNHVIMDVDKMLRRLIGEDVKLIVRLAQDLGNVTADIGQLQQVIVNLAVNARDAMPEGGTLLIETSNIFIDEAYCASHPETIPGAYVLLAVTDTGTGMTAEVRQRIFEPFFTTKPIGSGTGLGLATVHGMVRQAGGWIWVYSEPGAGTTFKIYLPRTDVAVRQEQAVARPDVTGDETVLLVEDQDQVRTLATAVLERYGYRVLNAASADEAIALAKAFQGQIHVLVTDLVMPGMNGRELAAQLAGCCPKVLFMSGYTENAIADRGILDPGVHYIQKPFTPESLAEKVRYVLGPRTIGGAQRGE